MDGARLSQTGLVFSGEGSYLFAVSTVQEIKAAIAALSPAERAELDRALHKPSRVGKRLKLPDQAARRRRIFGNRVLPNLVLEARESERT